MENTERKNLLHYLLSGHCLLFPTLQDTSIVLSTVVVKGGGDRWTKKNMA